MNNLIVQKFGGTSVANTERFQAVADLVVDSINSGTNVAVVVSAMAGETQRLINLAKELQESPDPREYDALVSSGEQVSAALLAIALKERNFLSKSYTAHQLGLVTDNSHGRARINSIDTSALKKDIESGWNDCKKFFESQSKISGAELYNYAVKSAEKYGWEFGGEIAGHLIGHFPHERLDNEDKRNYVHPQNHVDMFDPDKAGNRRDWILEIHYVDKSKKIGGFFEQLLTV